MQDVVLALVLESNKACDQQRMGKGHSRLSKGVYEKSGVAVCGWTTGDEEEMMPGKGRSRVEVSLGGLPNVTF